MLLEQTCKPLVDKYNSLYLQSRGIERQFTALISALETAVSNLTAAPVQDIYDAISRVNAVEIALDDAIGDDVQTLMSSECFRDLVPPSAIDKMSEYTSMVQFPISFSKKILKSIQLSLTSEVRDEISLGLQTGVVASLISSYNSVLKKSGLSDILDSLDYVYECLTSICGYTVTDHTSTIRSQLNLDYNNEFNMSVLSQWNVNVTVVEQLTLLKQTLDSAESEINALSF